jgi:hypothetical protein
MAVEAARVSPVDPRRRRCRGWRHGGDVQKLDYGRGRVNQPAARLCGSRTDELQQTLSGGEGVAQFNADLTTFFNIIGGGDIAFQNIFTGGGTAICGPKFCPGLGGRHS